MELIPREELKTAHSFNFAPMIDFLFLMLALFAILSVSRAVLYDTDIELAQLKPEAGREQLLPRPNRQPVHLSITAEGKYKWLTEFQEYGMETPAAIAEELTKQYQHGILPQDKTRTEVLLHIDEKAPWKPVAEVIFAVREIGFTIRPVYENLAEAKGPR